MKITFCGASKTVTGSNYLIEAEDKKLLLDCGMFQGSAREEQMNFESFIYNPKDIDYLILSHAHIDHSGRIPKLVKEGFNGKIYTTHATYDLCEIMLMDSANIGMQDAEWENRKRVRKGLTPIEPLYNTNDVKESLKLFKPVYYNQEIKIDDTFTFRLQDAGHILGSAIVELFINEEGKTTKLVFSGDLGMPERPILTDPTFIEDADYLIIESTYGDRDHPTYTDSTKSLIKIIDDTSQKGGTVVIPSFAVGRTQDLIYQLNSYYDGEGLEEYKKVPIYIDSPMAVSTTKVFEKNSNLFDEDAKNLILSGDNPFDFENIFYVRDVEESKRLNAVKYPKVIISASGMATAGRVRHHLKHNLWDPKNSVIIVGYQAEGSTGRKLVEGAKKVSLLGEEIKVEANIYSLQGFSAHADRSMLLNWIGHFKKFPKKIFLVHGEEKAITALKSEIENKWQANVHVPDLGDSVELYAADTKFNDSPVKEYEQRHEELLHLTERVEGLLKETNLDKDIYDKKFVKNNYDDLKDTLLNLEKEIMDYKVIVGK